MALSKEAYQALESIVGSEYITDDPLICLTYRTGGYGIDMCWEKGLVPPACVILPGSTEEVQQIVRVCNRYSIPYVPASAFWQVQCAPLRTDAVTIDLKRMNKLEIDDRHMSALVEPYVIYSQLQAEAMKRGLYTLVPGGGAQVSVLANSIAWSLSPLGYRFGWPHRRLLGVEWVLPDGEMLRLGSCSLNKDDYFWGEGLGTDLRGILRGTCGWGGGLGIVTKVAVKLLPFVPEAPKPVGISPDTTLDLPTDRMRWYNISYPSDEHLLEVMYKLAQSEIGAAMIKVPIVWRYRARAQSKEHFWQLWETEAKEEYKKGQRFSILRVLLIGYTSEKQLEYEERVLQDIVAETGGQFRRTRQSDESWIKNADSVAMWWIAGGYISTKFGWDSLDHAYKVGKAAAELKAKFIPPLVDEYGETGWFQATDLGHGGYLEFLVNWDPRDPKNSQKADQHYIASLKQDIEKGFYCCLQMSWAPASLTGVAYDNHNQLLLKLKQAFDPQSVSNPPRPLEMDEQIDKYCPWIKRDW